MSVLHNNPFLLASGNPTDPTFPVQRSVRLRSSATAYLNRTLASAGNTTKWTWSGWVKLGSLAAGSNVLFAAQVSTTNRSSFQFTGSTGAFSFYTYGVYTISTTAVYRDPSSWYHVCMVFDSANATAADRLIVYVNGIRQALSGTIALNYTCNFNQAQQHTIGSNTYNENFDGYLTEVNFIDGQALTPSSFGGYNTGTGVWEPRKYTGTYGTNGFYLNFQDNSGATATTIGKDSSGNSNNWTPNNISVTAGATYDSMLDVPTNTSPTNANFCTLNPLAISGAPSITEGNLTAAATAAAYAYAVCSQRIAFPVYFEATLVAAQNGVAGNAQLVGISNAPTLSSGFYISSDNGASLLYSYVINGGAKTSLGITPANGDILMFAYDTATGKIWAGRNGTWFLSGNPSAGTSPMATLSLVDYFPWVGHYSTQPKISFNFGQRPFTYTPPTGFLALNTFNLPDPTIANGATQFAATTYTGNGGTQIITNGGNNSIGKTFQPDFVWMKSRSNANNHQVQDSVRGATNRLFPNLTDAASTSATSLTSFNSNGFTLGADANINGSGVTFIGWQWKASNAAAVTNTSGSISSQVSANPSAGFSIVTYTGTGANATVGHGLGVAPSMIIAKTRGTTGDWAVYHASLGATKGLYLNQTVAAVTSAGFWNNTAPTSSVLTIATGATTSLLYCFSEIAGYSKFGSYTGNGSADGVFVYLGFRPRWLLIKRTDSTGNWNLYDSTRNPYNVTDLILQTNNPNADASGITFPSAIDFLSNGFKTRNYDATYGPNINANGGTYIYAAFAENPFKYSLAR